MKNLAIIGASYLQLPLIRKAKDMGYDAIRLDVFSLNPYARRLYEKNGFIKRGHAHWHMGEFYLMEKILK